MIFRNLDSWCSYNARARAMDLVCWKSFVTVKFHITLNDKIRCAYSWIMMRMIDTLSKLISFWTSQYGNKKGTWEKSWNSDGRVRKTEGKWNSIWDHRKFTVWNVAPTRISAIYRFISDEMNCSANATESKCTCKSSKKCWMENKIIDIIVA